MLTAPATKSPVIRAIVRLVERVRRLAQGDVGEGRRPEEGRTGDSGGRLVAVVRELTAHGGALGVDGLGDAAVTGDARGVAREHERGALPAVEGDDRRFGADEADAAARPLAVVRDVRVGRDERVRVGEEEPVRQQRNAVSQLVSTDADGRGEVRERAHQQRQPPKPAVAMSTSSPPMTRLRWPSPAVSVMYTMSPEASSIQTSSDTPRAIRPVITIIQVGAGVVCQPATNPGAKRTSATSFEPSGAASNAPPGTTSVEVVELDRELLDPGLAVVADDDLPCRARHLAPLRSGHCAVNPPSQT